MTAPDFMDIAAEVCGADDRKHVAELMDIAALEVVAADLDARLDALTEAAA